MTLRQMLGGDVQRVHELLEELLDREEVVVVLFDGDRAVNYISGFGLSASQHELLALDIERLVRAAGATATARRRRRRNRNENGRQGRLMRRIRVEDGVREDPDKAA